MVDRGAGMDRLSRNLALVTVPDDAFWEVFNPRISRIRHAAPTTSKSSVASGKMEHARRF